MKTVYKLLIWILITSLSGFGQNKIIESKVLSANNQTDLELDLRNAYTQLAISPDSNIYIDYSIDFKNYSVDELEKVLKGINQDVKKGDNSYVIKVDSKHTMSSKVYSLETEFGISMDKAFITSEQTQRKFKKSKESLLGFTHIEDSKAENILETMRKYMADGTTELVDLSKVKSFTVNFIIKIPKRIKLNLKLNNSEVKFSYDATNQIKCVSDNSTIRGLLFKNPLSEFNMENGSLKVQEISGGKFVLKDLNKVIIGGIDNVIIDSEFSDFSIGEIGKSVIINDFNSQFWLYEFVQELGDFTLNGEYSKINIYYPKERTNFLMTTYGYGTVHYYDNIKTEIRPSRKKTASKMMILGNDDSSTTNRLNINIVNGIVRLGEDFIDIDN